MDEIAVGDTVWYNNPGHTCHGCAGTVLYRAFVPDTHLCFWPELRPKTCPYPAGARGCITTTAPTALFRRGRGPLKEIAAEDRAEIRKEDAMAVGIALEIGPGRGRLVRYAIVHQECVADGTVVRDRVLLKPGEGGGLRGLWTDKAGKELREQLLHRHHDEIAEISPSEIAFHLYDVSGALL